MVSFWGAKWAPGCTQIFHNWAPEGVPDGLGIVLVRFVFRLAVRACFFEPLWLLLESFWVAPASCALFGLVLGYSGEHFGAFNFSLVLGAQKHRRRLRGVLNKRQYVVETWEKVLVIYRNADYAKTCENLVRVLYHTYLRNFFRKPEVCPVGLSYAAHKQTLCW